MNDQHRMEGEVEVWAMRESVEELVACLPAMEQKDAEACRARAVRYFSHTAMAAEYLRFYREYLSTGVLPAGVRSAD